MNRRQFVIQTAALTASASIPFRILSGLTQATASQYVTVSENNKALVVVFLRGGADGLSMVVPKDTANDQKYREYRQSLAIPRDSLLNLGEIPFGLHPAMESKSIF